MNRTDAPAKQPKPFGINGQREPILPTTPAGDNTASYESGFPPITMILKSAGGLPPKGQDVNQILYELSALCRWASSGALNSYDATFSTGIGGYPKGSVLLSDDGSNIFISTSDANIENPNLSNNGWLNLFAFLGLGSLAKQNSNAVNITGGIVKTTQGSLFDGSNRVYSAANPGATFSSDGTGLWFNVLPEMLQVRIGSWSLGPAAGATAPITFVQAFSHGCLIVVPIPDISANDQIGVLGRTLTGATLSKGNADISPRSGQYIAFGY